VEKEQPSPTCKDPAYSLATQSQRTPEHTKDSHSKGLFVLINVPVETWMLIMMRETEDYYPSCYDT